MFRKSSDGTHYRQSFFARNFRTSRKAAERMKHGRIERPRKAALLRRDGLIHSPVPRCDGAGRRGLLDAAAEKYDGQGRGECLLTGRASRAGRNAADAGSGAAAGGGQQADRQCQASPANGSLSHDGSLAFLFLYFLWNASFFSFRISSPPFSLQAVTNLSKSSSGRSPVTIWTKYSLSKSSSCTL